MSYDPSEATTSPKRPVNRRVCVRDVSWHSQVSLALSLRSVMADLRILQQPILMSAGWLGGGWGSNESSVIARHEWKGLSKMQYSLEDYVEQQQSERTERAQRRAATRAMPGTFRIESDEEF